MTPQLLWAARAWVGGRWAQDVLLHVGSSGDWARITPDTPASAQAIVLAGPVLPNPVSPRLAAVGQGLTRRKAACSTALSYPVTKPEVSRCG